MIGLGITVLVMVVLVVGCATAVYRAEGVFSGVLAGVVVAIIGALIIGWPLGAFLIPATGGIGPIGQGISTGYVVELKHSGLIWRTWDGTILLGNGEQTAAGELAKFSVADGWVTSKLRGFVGQRTCVRLEYDEWCVAPAWVGSHCRVVRWVEVMPDDKPEAEETPGR